MARMIKVEIKKILFYPPSKGYAVLLKEIEGERQLPIIVGAFEAQSIALALEKTKMPRPLTHDLFINILKELDMNIQKIVITDLRDGTFYARIFLEKIVENTILQVDSRPSDAIALALRMNAPLYVAKTVMDVAGQMVTIKERDAVDNDETIPEAENLDKLFDLQSKLQQAVEDENYELAAKLRDQINILQKGIN